MIATVLVALFVTLAFATSAAAQNSQTSNHPVKGMQQQIDDLNKRVTALEHILHPSPNGDICIGAC